MAVILRVLLRWTGWLTLSFIIVVAALALFHDLPGRISSWKHEANDARATAMSLAAARSNFEEGAQDAVSKADREIAALRSAGAAELKRAESEITRQRSEARGRILNSSQIAWAAARGQTDTIVASYRAQYLELLLLDRAAALISVRLSNLRERAKLATQLRSIRDRIDAHNRKVADFNRRLQDYTALQQRAKMQWRNPLCSQAAVPLVCARVRRVRELKKDLDQHRPSLDQEKRVLKAEKAAIRALRLQREAVADGQRVAGEAVAALDHAARESSSYAENLAWNKTERALRRYGWQAFWIVIGGVLLPVLHKAFAFWIIAPLASRTAPVRLREPGPSLLAGPSGVAVDAPIDRETELLVRSGVQDRSSDIRVDDKLFFKNRMFLACIAAGLVNLQRFRSSRHDHVTVTGTDDEHYEVALIDVPEGGAMVLQPRALVGVVKPRARTLAIERPWRLRWMISWITFQFRYIVFHGPCTLIVQGRRGVRVKDAAEGRATNKRLVLGFDAGLAYGAARSSSFRPYLFGRASLFDDRFTGRGRYVYEERPAGAGKGSIWGRGLKGIGDAILSALGI
ncbi:hypothetical protein [Sphingomonas melonis]|uniref:Uncharacterized protein n=1 Tax=Sphingomonas melonis TaxID=152682 RepID=A0A7Y9FQI3_9SPHN|nr:hypothetical protein [Sphingomonas melonis]NYD91616.1 hypothetical protein [Sphingomonas melonis]